MPPLTAAITLSPQAIRPESFTVLVNLLRKEELNLSNLIHICLPALNVNAYIAVRFLRTDGRRSIRQFYLNGRSVLYNLLIICHNSACRSGTYSGYCHKIKPALLFDIIYYFINFKQ